MYLKEAFRYQNFLGTLHRSVKCYLSNDTYITRTTQEHLRKAVNPEAENEITDMMKERLLPFSANEMVEFMCHILCEREALTAAINKAKKNCPVDIDGEIANNKVRHDVAESLAYMANVRPRERKLSGSAFKFNVEGNQTQYRYDINEVTCIDFNRNVVKARYKSIQSKADDVSAALDKAMVDTNVDYDPPYSINNSFEECMEEFVEKLNA